MEERLEIVRPPGLVSVICVFNDREILEGALLRGLLGQTEPYEVILLDNTCRAYSSAAAALNEGAGRARGDLLVFVHQDVIAGSPSFLADMRRFLSDLPVAVVTGVAGKRDNHVMYSDAVHGEPPVPAGNQQFHEPLEVLILDECLLSVPARVFREIWFDPVACPDWHLYGTDLCYAARKTGIPVIVLPLVLHHLSPGTSLSARYYTTLWRLLGKYGSSEPGILTSLGWYPGGVSGRLRLAACFLIYGLSAVLSAIKEFVAKGR